MIWHGSYQTNEKTGLRFDLYYRDLGICSYCMSYIRIQSVLVDLFVSFSIRESPPNVFRYNNVMGDSIR